jgi:hypothetical protein
MKIVLIFVGDLMYSDEKLTSHFEVHEIILIVMYLYE